MLALSFPRYGHAAVALVAIVPLLVALAGWRGRTGVYPGHSFRKGAALGAAAGLVHYMGTIYWTGAVVQTYGGLAGPIALLVALLLALYMSVYTALSSGLIAATVQRLGARGLLLAPLLWVAGEFARGHVLGGFPWIPLGSAVVTILPVAQLASLIGVYGVSFFLVLQGTLVARAITGTSRDRLAFGGAAAALLVTVSVWGSWRVADGALTREGTPLVVGLIQANIAQADKWNPRMAGEIAGRYDRMTRESAAAGADVILWPESSTQYFFNEDPVSAGAVRALVRDLGVPLLFGTDEIERATPDRYYNSAMMLDPTGAVAAVYRKIQLVPFGEYVPLRRLLFFVQPLVEAVSDFTPGERVTMLPVGEHMASTAICYEIVYPHLMRQAVLEGAELLTTITNDAWYGDSSAPYQHFELASMRAIEQGRYLVRAANTGISGVVDPYGRVMARTRVFEDAVVNAEVRFLQTRTLYATIGDLVAQISLLGALLTAVWLTAVRRAR
ncbi:MAG TPA: apolipoprotein N-acyltransferase [Vicinamibacterales bacterium]|nr:apolipoprotein N-acyltransferase [Vicinamibacterales bacterium]